MSAGDTSGRELTRVWIVFVEQIRHSRIRTPSSSVTTFSSGSHSLGLGRAVLGKAFTDQFNWYATPQLSTVYTGDGFGIGEGSDLAACIVAGFSETGK
jgi:hypothetical protein